MNQPGLPAVEPKPPRRMRKPLKAWLYAEVDRLMAENAALRDELAVYHEIDEAQAEAFAYALRIQSAPMLPPPYTPEPTRLDRLRTTCRSLMRRLMGRG